MKKSLSRQGVLIDGSLNEWVYLSYLKIGSAGYLIVI